MKCETLNGILTFVLGVFVVLAVVLAMRMILITHETRVLQKRAQFDQAIIVQTESVYNDTVAYNERVKDPVLANIIQHISTKPAAR